MNRSCFAWNEKAVSRLSPFLLRGIIFLVLLLPTLGCKYDGAMMQMNSDSPSPFFGLQLSVKADQPKGLSSFRRRFGALKEERLSLREYGSGGVSAVLHPDQLSAANRSTAVRRHDDLPYSAKESLKTTLQSKVQQQGSVEYSADDDVEIFTAEQIQIRLNQF